MDRKSRFTAIKTNDFVDCKFLSHVNTFQPGLHCSYWHSLNHNATACALATYTHSVVRSLERSYMSLCCLPVYPTQTRILLYNIVCLSLGFSDGFDTRGQHTQFSVHTEIYQPSVGGAWRSCAQLTH